VTVFDYALSDTTDKADIFIPKPDPEIHRLPVINYGNSGFDIPEETRSISVSVERKRLDDVYGGVPSFIKLDVEGHESKVLKGALDLITKYKPAIMVEIHDMKSSEVDPFLKGLGYGAPVPRPEHMFLYQFSSEK